MSRAGLLCLLALAVARLTAAEQTDLLLIAANEALLQPVLDQLANPRTETHAAWRIWSGQLAGKNIVLTRSEGDPLNAVAAATLAIRLHQPRLVVVYGVGRAHDPALQAGDIVVSREFAAFDGMLSPVTALGAGSHPLRWNKLPHRMMGPGERETPAESFPADHAALELALNLAVPRGRVVAGVLGSANQINREVDRIAWLREQWHSSTEDNESAHVAGCAVLFGVPVVGFRVVAGRPEEVAEFALRFVKAWR